MIEMPVCNFIYINSFDPQNNIHTLLWSLHFKAEKTEALSDYITWLGL